MEEIEVEIEERVEILNNNRPNNKNLKSMFCSKISLGIMSLFIVILIITQG